jgi:ligand-binding sensor domain-containing protein/signal transduction histidine kinase
VVLIGLALAGTLCAASRYSRRVWRAPDGLPEDYAQALAQTPDGYLWIGTSGGLVRFDGSRFTVFSPSNTPALHDDSIYSLLVSSDGTLWAGTEGGGLVRYASGKFRSYGIAEGLTNGFVRVIFEDRERRLWVGTDHGLFRMDGDRLTRVDAANDVHEISAHSICEDRRGRLLVAGGGLLVLDGQRSAYYQSTETLADNAIRAIHEERSGAVWIGTISGLRRLPDGVVGNPFLTPRVMSGVNTDVLLETREGQMWVGTYGSGLMRWTGAGFERLTAPALLPHNNLLSLFQDTEGNIWVGTQGGLMRMSPSAATTLTTADREPQSINTIYQDPRGELYVTALNGRLLRVADDTLVPVKLPPAFAGMPIRNVYRDGGGVLWMGTDGQGAVRGSARLTMRDGLVNEFVRAFCEDREGAMWIGTDGGLSRYRDGVFRNFNTQDGLAYGSIRALLVDHAGDLWVATDGGLSRFHAGAFATDPLLDKLRGQKVWALHEDPEGGMWVGTHGGGLMLLKHGELRRYTSAQGPPFDKIYFLAEDARGRLWMSGPGGVASIARRDLESRTGQLPLRLYSTSEGLNTDQMNGGVQPAGAITSTGELWFPSTNGAVRIDPNAPDLGAAPPVLIEQVQVGRTSRAPAAGRVTVAPGEGNLEIQYTAIRLRSPEHTRFKYWMEGFDHEWTEAGQRRIAYYTALPPGAYTFHVVAYEVTDPNRSSEQTLGVDWRPHFYQTAWFLALCAAAALSAALGAWRLHVRNLRQRFAAVLEERNRLAREMHDTLIQGCVGVSTLLEAASGAREVSPAIATELLERARDEVRHTVDEARLAVWNLRQEKADHLAEAVADLARRASVETGISVAVQTSGEAVALGGEAERSLLLVIREAVLNALRHAGPTRVNIRLAFAADGVEVEIQDDGSGFDAVQVGATGGHHYGLIGMRERVEKLGGRFNVTSGAGQGTSVRVRVDRPGK